MGTDEPSLVQAQALKGSLISADVQAICMFVSLEEANATCSEIRLCSDLAGWAANTIYDHPYSRDRQANSRGFPTSSRNKFTFKQKPL